ncbi:MAG TPA: hypothetical protein PK280_06160 [Planctomycetota bacterium]|nr:hypothetical protein [Planctomycetota bacterium]
MTQVFRHIRHMRRPAWAALLALAALIALPSGPGRVPASGAERRPAAGSSEASAAGVPDPSPLLTSAERPWEAEVPGGATGRNIREVAVSGDLRGGKLSVRLRLASAAPQPVRASVYIVNRQGWFYKSAQDYLVSHLRSTSITLDLGPESADLVPASALARPWAATGGAGAARMGIGLYSSARWSGQVEVLEARIEAPSPAAAPAGAPRADGLTVVPARPAAGAMAEISFVFPAEFANPFDPAAAALDAELVPVAGQSPATAVVPAYFDQGYLPLTEGFGERMVPVGPPRWKVRLRAPAQGDWTVRLRWRGAVLAEVPLAVGPARKAAAAAGASVPAAELDRLAVSGGESFLRRLPADPDRSWAVLRAGRFQPVAPPPGSSGALAGWIAPLEWTRSWGAWLGAGRYNLEAAARLDAVLDRAAERGVRLPLFVNFDGPFLDNDRYRWEFNPLAAPQGGPVKLPSLYYRDETAGPAAEALFRYLAARYGAHPAVDGLILAATLGADGAEDWHDRMARSLSASFGGEAGALRLASLHPMAVRRRAVKSLGSFEAKPTGIEGGWRFDTDVCPPTRAAYSAEAASEGRQSLRVEAEMPGELCLVRVFDQDTINAGDYDLLSFDLRLPAEAPRGLRAMLYLRDRELNWYEELLPGELRPGDWTRFTLDLREGRNGLKAAGHSRPWDGYSRQRFRAVGVRIFGAGEYVERPYKGPVYLDNVRLLGDPETPEERPALAITGLREPEDRNPALFTRVEYTFGINRTFANPFDPECVEVRARVLAPSGQLLTVPGFFYQGYRRTADKEYAAVIDGARKRIPAPEGAERLEPEGPGLWKVRLSAAEAGTHQVTIEVLVPDAQGRMAVAASRKGLSFEAAAGNVPGFIRPAADRRHFEHSSGEFFYPIGMAIRSPSDARDLGRDSKIRRHIQGDEPVAIWREAGHTENLDLLDLRGTYQFDDYFKRCGENGVNWARVWMAPWWLGLEWDHRYPGYEGAGRYNLANAWRMDHVLEEAERNGIYLQLCLTNHGQVTTRIDRQWDFNPYNAVMPKFKLWNLPDRPAYEIQGPEYYAPRPGGFADNPQEWFQSERARKLTRQRLRYIVARWGYSPKVMAWGLMSEVEFTGGTDFGREGNWDRGSFPLQTEWHREMGRYLRAVDPHRHLVTSHFSHPCNGLDLWALPEMDCVHSNAYSSFPWLGGGNNENAIVGAPRATQEYYARHMSRYNKPVLIGEWGGFHMRNSKEILDSELHSGLWAEAMTPLGGATGWWWWLHVHYNDRYGEFAALARFMKGEDLRGVVQQLSADGTVAAPGGGGERRGLEVLAIGDGARRAYAWAYHPRIAWGEADKAVFEGAKVRIGGLAPGTYEVEFWNPARGERVSRGEFAAGADRLVISLPKFERDLAMKIRAKGEAAR